MKLRISVSKLEQFRKYLAGEFNGYITMQMIVDDIMGVRKTSEKMELGTAYHALIEWQKDAIEVVPLDNSDGDAYSVKTPDMTGPVLFYPQVAQPALQYRKDHPHLIHEIPLYKDVVMKGHAITISGRMDAQEGFEGRDVKTGDKPLDFELWEHSYQWRLYCWMASLVRFHYDIFKFERENGQLNNVIYQTCAFNAYPYMGQDCLNLVGRFIDFAEGLNLVHHMEVKPKPAST